MSVLRALPARCSSATCRSGGDAASCDNASNPAGTARRGSEPSCMRRRAVPVLVACATLAVMPAGAAPQGVDVTVDVARVVGTINRNLCGLDWKLGTGAADTALQPRPAP